jgi:hypothetical protein
MGSLIGDILDDRRNSEDIPIRKAKDKGDRQYVIDFINKHYDEFFGEGIWEAEYKKHIVEFTRQCVNAL